MSDNAWWALRPPTAGGGGGAAPTTGLLYITGGTITTPTAFIDLALSEDYVSFHLQMIGIEWDSIADADTDVVAAVLSFDGGGSFLGDANNYDTYRQNTCAFLEDGSPAAIHFSDSAMQLSYSARYDTSVWVDILPGSSTRSPRIIVRSAASWLDAAGAILNFGAWDLNPTATAAPTLARADYLRIGPYADGSLASPATGATMISGSYALWGLKV